MFAVTLVVRSSALDSIERSDNETTIFGSDRRRVTSALALTLSLTLDLVTLRTLLYELISVIELDRPIHRVSSYLRLKSRLLIG